MKKVIRAEVAVECDEDVTPEMVRDILRLQMWNAFSETTNGGHINWQKMRVSIAEKV